MAQDRKHVVMALEGGEVEYFLVEEEGVRVNDEVDSSEDPVWGVCLMTVTMTTGLYL